MKRRINKKGMTLVEVIIAMSVFAIISTGFVMSATYAYKAQVKARKRLTQSNNQTTNLEDFSGMIDPEYSVDAKSVTSDLGVQRIGSETGKWTMTYKFGSIATITNDRMRAYHSKPDEDDGVYELAYFSPNDKVALEPGEYWITITNTAPEGGPDLPLCVKCADSYVLFNNEKKLFQGRTTMPDRIIPAGDYSISFGVKDLRGGYYDSGSCVWIYNSIANELSGGTSSPLTGINPFSDADHYININYNGTTFVPGE